jgi:DNA-binding phage protein
MTANLDHEQLAAQWLRAMRGKRSQRAFSRRLGYRTNIAYRWESGRCWPTASSTLRAMKKLGFDVRAALQRFVGGSESWVDAIDPSTPAGIAELLEHLRQRTPMVAIAQATGYSRFAIARWLKGQAEPRLPELLHLVQACTLRLLDFVAAFFTPEQLPMVAAQLRKLEASRVAAYGEPLSHAVLRVLELESYRALPRHQEGWIAARLGIALEDERRCLRVLADAGQIRRHKKLWLPHEEGLVDTRVNRQGAQRLKSYWARHAIGLIESGQPDVLSSFNLMSISEVDLERLRELTRNYYREMREIVARSSPNERVVLFTAQLMAIDRV